MKERAWLTKKTLISCGIWSDRLGLSYDFIKRGYDVRWDKGIRITIVNRQGNRTVGGRGTGE